MNKHLDSANPPPTESEMRRFESELFEFHHEFLKRYCLKKSKKLDAESFAGDVCTSVAKKYRSKDSFRADIQANGIQKLRKIPYFWGIVRNTYNEHKREFAKAIPRETTIPEMYWLRFVNCRDDGMVFPLVRTETSLDERHWLGKLEGKKINKVCRVPAEADIGIWVRDRVKGPMTLVPTKKGKGGGESDLENLVARLFLEPIPCADPRIAWKTIDGVLHALQLTATGRQYIRDLSYGVAHISIDEHGEGVLASGLHRPPDNIDDDGHWTDGFTLKEVLDVAVARFDMPETAARIYLLHKVGDPPEQGPWPRWRIADEVGLHHRKVERIEKAWDEHFRNPEVRDLMKIVLGRD